MNNNYTSNKLNNLLRNVAEECIKLAKDGLKEKGLNENPIVITGLAYTVCMEWTKTMFTQIMGECQQLQKKYNDSSEDMK